MKKTSISLKALPDMSFRLSLRRNLVGSCALNRYCYCSTSGADNLEEKFSGIESFFFISNVKKMKFYEKSQRKIYDCI